MTNAETRLKDLGITLPDPIAPVANYVPFVISGDLVYVSGQVSIGDGKLIAGKLGSDLDIDAGQAAARACAINLISQLKIACDGELARLHRVVKLVGFVNSTPDFTDQPLVINGASDLMVEIFGPAGRHARAAVSTPSLPLGAAVEVDAVFQITS